jgi:hypothetical protein
MANEVRVPVIGEDRASRPFREVGRSADIAALGARRLADALEAQRRAAKAAADADLSLAKANAILAVSEHRISAEQDRARAKLRNDLSSAIGNPRAVSSEAATVADIVAAATRRRASPTPRNLIRGLGSWRALGQLFGIGPAGGGAAGAAEGATGGGGNFFATPGGAGLAAILGVPTSAVAASLFAALAGQGLGTAGAGAGAALTQAYRPSALAPGLSNISRTLSTVTQSFAPSLGLMFVQFGKVIQGLAPVMAKFFASTLPFMRQFLTLAAVAAKTILPAMTQALQAMVKSGALTAMTQGFVFLIQGVADFIKEIGGPGMKAGAEIFRAAALAIRATLIAVGAALHWLGGYTKDWLHQTAVYFDDFRHATAAAFDAALVTFDEWRHGWAHIWDTVYSDTIGTVIRLDRDVIGWFAKIPGQVRGALRGLGQLLEDIGALALHMLLSGLESAAHPVLSFVQSIGHDILSIFDKAIGRSSPSKAFFAAGVDLMKGLDLGIKSHASKVFGTVSGVGGGVTSWITAALRMAHEPLSWLPALQRLVSMESGGNPNAVNPVQVLGQHASGLWQMLPSTFAAYGGVGSLFNPIVEGVAALRYIAATYGSPYGIPGLFGGGYQGYAYGTSSARPGWAVVGERGPEVVRFRGGEQVYPGAGSVTVHIHAPVGSNARDIGYKLAEYLKAFQRGGGTVLIPGKF